VGSVYTLISTTGSLTGMFAGVPDGAMLALNGSCPRGQGLATLARINYTSQSVTATIVAAPTVAQIRSALKLLLRPTGRNARIGRLLKNGGYTFSLPSLAGRLRLAWTVKPRHRHLTIAVVTVTLTGGGPTKLKIALTKYGRGVLKHHRSVKVTGTAYFEPAATAFVGLSPHVTFTLHR
jgi:hypothetical protein